MRKLAVVLVAVLCCLSSLAVGASAQRPALLASDRGSLEEYLKDYFENYNDYDDYDNYNDYDSYGNYGNDNGYVFSEEFPAIVMVLYFCIYVFTAFGSLVAMGIVLAVRLSQEKREILAQRQPYGL